MSNKASPLVISAPEPRTLDLIFTPPQLALFRKKYRIVETTPEGVSELPTDVLAEARYIVGQPPITPQTLERLKALRCIFNVETNLINNMPYETLFARGIHVVTTGLVFAEPVAELGLAMALNLARGIVDADLAFRQGEFVFVVASVTSENQGFLGADAFAKMRQGAAFILLSRAGVVDFPALMGAVKSGHIVAASDVFPEEPLAKNHPVRSLSGFLRSAHRAGALDVAFKRMG
ncbi:MAG: hypothetical protein E5Y35_25190, partial [Mesorhizobium sp.]